VLLVWIFSKMTSETQGTPTNPPAAGLVSRAESLAGEINELAGSVESINVFNPISSFNRLAQANKTRATLRPQVKEMLGESLGMMRARYSGPGIALATIQTQSLGESLAATLLIQNQWQRLVGAVDRKSAFTVAVISIYISVTSLVVTACFGVASLL